MKSFSKTRHNGTMRQFGLCATAYLSLLVLTQSAAQAKPNWMWPLANEDIKSVSSTFGPRLQHSSGKVDWHHGIDIGTPGEGRSVKIVAPGTYVRSGDDRDRPGYFYVAFKHQVGEKTYYSYYMHLQSLRALQVLTGRTVSTGEEIGKSGGSAGFAHLHFEVRYNDQGTLDGMGASDTQRYAVHPLRVLKSRPGQEGAAVSATINSQPKSSVSVSLTSARYDLNTVCVDVYADNGKRMLQPNKNAACLNLSRYNESYDTGTLDRFLYRDNKYQASPIEGVTAQPGGFSSGNQQYTLTANFDKLRWPTYGVKCMRARVYAAGFSDPMASASTGDCASYQTTVGEDDPADGNP